MEILKTVFFQMVLNIVMSTADTDTDPHKVLDSISSSFGRVILECQKEVIFGNDVIDEFLRYWEPGHPLDEKELGCVVFCLLIKLDLTDTTGTLKMMNASVFGKANGADEELIKGLVTMYEECKGNIKFVDPCTDGMNLANCFREKVFLVHWAPDPV